MAWYPSRITFMLVIRESIREIRSKLIEIRSKLIAIRLRGIAVSITSNVMTPR